MTPLAAGEQVNATLATCRPYIYIYIHREREKEKEQAPRSSKGKIPLK